MLYPPMGAGFAVVNWFAPDCRQYLRSSKSGTVDNILSLWVVKGEELGVMRETAGFMKDTAFTCLSKLGLVSP